MILYEKKIYTLFKNLILMHELKPKINLFLEKLKNRKNLFLIVLYPGQN
jgi:hypothetical protein